VWCACHARGLKLWLGSTQQKHLSIGYLKQAASLTLTGSFAHCPEILLHFPFMSHNYFLIDKFTVICNHFRNFKTTLMFLSLLIPLRMRRKHNMCDKYVKNFCFCFIVIQQQDTAVTRPALLPITRFHAGFDGRYHRHCR